MSNNNIAVMDITSSEVTVAVVDRGVNGTFVIKSRHSSGYSGYAEGEMLDEFNFANTIKEVLSETMETVRGPIKKFYVGVPGEFIEVVTPSPKTLSFKTSKKITDRDLSAVMKAAKPAGTEKYAVVSGGSLDFTLSDTRRMINPVGEVSDILQARHSFFLAKRTFCSAVEREINSLPVKADIEIVPSMQAEGMYLFPAEMRESPCLLLDFGYISSTCSLIYGNGILFAESMSVGAGHLAYLIADRYSIPYNAAYIMLGKTNLNVNDAVRDPEEAVYEGNTYSCSSDKIRDAIREGLDILCELIEEELAKNEVGQADLKTLYVTGDGIITVRGTCEYLSHRLKMNVVTVTPQLPYYDKPQFSSLFSLMNAAMDGGYSVR